MISVYCGTYHKYNSGSIDGAWVDLSDFSSLEDLYKHLSSLHEDEEDPEYMFQDYEVPSELRDMDLVSEFHIHEDIYEIMEKFHDLQKLDVSGWVWLHNQFCEENGREDDEIYSFDEEFFQVYFRNNVMNAARAAVFGSVNFSHDWVSFDGNGNLETSDNPLVEWIDEAAIIEWKLDL